MLRSIPLFVCSALLAALPAQDRRGPVPRPTRFEPVAGNEDPTNLVLKFVEGSGVRLRGGEFISAAGAPLPGVAAALGDGADLERLFQRTEAELDRERAALMARLVGRDVDPPADLNLYFRVRSTVPAAGIARWRALAALPLVETVFCDTPPGYDADPTDIPPTTPDYSSQQGYWGAHPTGIDIVHSRVIPGGRGEPLQILDIETALRLDHEDIPEAIAANVIGPNPQSTYHGMAVAGEMVADKNGYGVTGGVYKARFKFHSHQSQNWASSVNVAATNSVAGDIIVLEVQLPCPVTGVSVCPMEGRQDVFDAVRNATLAGIHVIAAAGNGSRNLDSASYAGLFDRNVRDSGAVICGATNGSQLARASFSNFGTIVDANGWGRNVTTTGYGALFFPNGDQRQTYTATFSGTSSATPIVTSAAAATLGAAKFQLGQVLSPAQLRTLLQNHGTVVTSIGRRPDVGALMGALGLPNGLTLQAETITGGTATLDVTATTNELWFLAASWEAGETVLPYGRLLLGSTYVSVAAGTGNGQFQQFVPNETWLRGAELHWQAAKIDTTTLAISLTSSIVTHFER
ncbi:MAG: S8 family serine peptidase [bacterium]|nr:S8 family serine peptidase [bacterium]